MKKILSLLLALSFAGIIAQNISIKEYQKIDSTNVLEVLQKISPQLIKKYQSPDKGEYLDNIFRIQMLSGHHEDALKSLYQIREIYKSNKGISEAMGVQFEVYINTLKNPKSKTNFEEAYIEELMKKYQALSPKAQIAMSGYFTNNISQLKKDILSSIAKDFTNKDSVSLESAVLLSRRYNTYLVGSKSFQWALHKLRALDQEKFQVQDSLVLKTKKGHEITVTVVLNKQLPKPEATILVNTIYAATSNATEAKMLAGYGYHAIYVNTRGKYLSKDAIEPFENEAEDLYDLIDWIAKQPWSNGKVGMIGGSYLGFSQWAATKKWHPALKTIVPQVAVGAGIDFPMSNNVFMSYMLRWLNYVTSDSLTNYGSFSNEEKWKEAFKKWYVSGAAFNRLDQISDFPSPLFQRWLQHPDFDAYWQKMIPYQKEFANIKIPVLTTTGYYDDDQIGALYYYKNHIQYLPKAEHYVVIGPYDHAGGQGMVKEELLGMKIDQVAKIDFDELCNAWFDYTLKGLLKPAFLKDKINYQVMGENVWKSAPSLKTFDQNKVKFYLHKDLKLSPKSSRAKDFSVLKVDLADRKDVDELLNEEPAIVTKKLLNTGSFLEFKTEVFDQDFELTGDFTGNLSLAINKKDVDLALSLYEKLPNGDYHFLSYYIGRASYAHNNEVRKLLTPNQKTIIPLHNTIYTSKKIRKGSQLVLLIGVNKSPQWQINYGTGKEVSTETIQDALEPMELKFYQDSFIEIPLVK